ncbi:hypothetical protein IIC65_06270 [Candidatus Sumerlaeota bacterium]|nr:hypothetical protein [Candidatus Sumerlaeota bacterium]
MLGLAEVLSRLSRMELSPILRRLGRGLVICLVIWNVHFFFCYRAGIQLSGEPFAGRRLITRGFQWPEVIKRDFGTLFRPKFTLFTPTSPE